MFEKQVVIILCIVSLCLGCAPAKFVRPIYCEGQASLIYDTADRMGVDPVTIQNLLAVGSTIAIQNKVVPPETLFNALDAMSGYLQQPLTYRTFVVIAQTYIAQINTKAGSAVLLISPFLSFLDKPLPISECDKQLLLKCVTDLKAQVLDLLSKG